MTRQKAAVQTFIALTCLAILTCAFVAPVKAELTAENTLVRVEIKEHSETVKISVPLGLLDTIYTVMPKEIHEACESLELTPQNIIKELETLEGDDLVRITGDEEVRVWFENVTPENRKDINFVTVFVKDEHGGDNEIHVKVPKGLVKLAARVIKELDIVEECIDLPPEVRRALDKIKDKKDA